VGGDEFIFAKNIINEEAKKQMCVQEMMLVPSLRGP